MDSTFQQSIFFQVILALDTFVENLLKMGRQDPVDSQKRKHAPPMPIPRSSEDKDSKVSSQASHLSQPSEVREQVVPGNTNNDTSSQSSSPSPTNNITQKKAHSTSSEEESIEGTITSAGVIKLMTGKYPSSDSGSDSCSTCSSSRSTSPEGQTQAAPSAEIPRNEAHLRPQKAKFRPTFKNNRNQEPERQSEENDQVKAEAEQPQLDKRGRIGFPLVSALPPFFPDNIRKIYGRDRKGAALQFQELKALLKFRSILAQIHHHKFKRYLIAGENRFRLQSCIRRLQHSESPKKFIEYRKKQWRKWRAEALKRWKPLERLQWGMEVIDCTVNLEFRRERMIYKKMLPERKWGRCT